MGHKLRSLRHPRTTQEARFSQDVDHKVFVRPKRNRTNLPEAYDDIFLPYRRHLSWKVKSRFRKQYMG